jgi:hypothetical protein
MLHKHCGSHGHSSFWCVMISILREETTDVNTALYGCEDIIEAGQAQEHVNLVMSLSSSSSQADMQNVQFAPFLMTRRGIRQNDKP